MKLVHFADPHLGYRQFGGMDSTGRNRREAAVATTFSTVVDQVIAIAPDVIVIGGDVFHVTRPSNRTIVEAFGEFSRLMQALPAAVLVMVAGNHDLPRETSTGCILQIFTKLGVHVVDREAQRLTFPELSLSVLAVPDVYGRVRPVFAPDPSCRFNVVVMHGEVQGMLRGAQDERAALEIPVDEIGPAGWDYVALGHYHVYRELAPNMYYSGSTDYTSTNPWGEMVEEQAAGLSGKGFAERDLVTGQQTFHPLPAYRPYVELPAFSAHEMSVVDIDDAIRAAVDGCIGGIEGKAVRIVITDVAPGMARELDHKAIRGYKSRALNFQVTTRTARVLSFGSSMGPVSRRLSLDEIVGEFFAKREWPADIDRDKVLALAGKYLADAEPATIVPIADEDSALVEAEESAA